MWNSISTDMEVWNSISTDMRELGRTKLNKEIKRTLLTILELENNYVDEHFLVQKMAEQWH